MATAYLVDNNIPQGLTSIVTKDFAAGLTLPSFFFLYSASRSFLILSASASSSSSSLPKRSTSSSSSSAAGALAGFKVRVLTSGPYVVYSLDASPGRVAKSSDQEVMCLYHLAACGYFEASGADLRALKETTSAWEGEYLDRCQFPRYKSASNCKRM